MRLPLSLLVMAQAMILSVAWTSRPIMISTATMRRTTALQQAVDYNDPVVAEEFAAVQPMAFEDVEEELQQSGIRVPPTMNDMVCKERL